MVLEVTDFAVFLTDPDGCLVSWNPGVERLLGYSEPEWLGQQVQMIFTPEDRAAGKPDAEMTLAARDGRAPDVRWHQRRDGSRLFVEGTLVALRDGGGTLLGFSKVMRDVTERQETEDALRASEQRLRALMQASSEVLYRMSPDWDEMRHLGGGGFLPDTETPSPNWLSEYIPFEDQSAVRAAIQNAIQTESAFELEHRVRRVDGTLGWTFSRAIPVMDAQGKITEWFGAATDITSRKEADAEREHLLRELARSNEDLSQFARIASHDLRAPLSTIAQFSQLLLKRYRGKVLDESADDYLNLLISNAKRMSALTSDLLRYAEVASAPLVPAQLTAAAEAFETAVANLRSEVEESGAVVTSGTLPQVRLPSTFLGQILQNLIENAMKYGGKERPLIHVAAEERADYYLFSVKDNGIGVEKQYQTSIFTPFKRLHGPEIEGSGMGLAVCQKIVERAGGRIWLESEPGCGATVFFTVPR